MKISLISAMGSNRVIGINNTLPWRLPADMKHFRQTTFGKAVLMGRKTYESIGKPLFGRTNIIVSSDPYYKVDGAFVATSLDAAISLAESWGHEELMVIGGATIYQQLLPRADKLYLTIIDQDFDGDAWFPGIDPKDWKELEWMHHNPDNDNHYHYSFLILERKSITIIDF